MRYRGLSGLAEVRVSTGALQRVVENRGFSDAALHAKARAVLTLLQTAQPTPVADT
jgi:signal transduction histidine kinase